MPTGAYLLTDHEGPFAVERFSCAPGPAGWRYAATREDPTTGERLGRLDLTLDAAGRVVRLLMTAGAWELRGGVAGPEAIWRRGHDERTATAAGFTGTSPAFAVAAARLLRLGPGQERRVPLVAVTEPVLATRTVEQGWRLPDVVDGGGLPVQRYDVTDLSTGERRAVALAGDVVVAADGVELLQLDGPPTLDRP